MISERKVDEICGTIILKKGLQLICGHLYGIMIVSEN